MAGLTPAHLLIILVIALVVIGPGKLPEVGAAIGKSLREFQKATGQIQEPQRAAQSAPLAPVQPVPVASAQVVQVAPAQVVQAAEPYYGGQPGYGAPAYPVQPGYPPAAYPVQPGYGYQPAPVVGEAPPVAPKVD